jgi:2-polyprenyl-3-methyl-5-hydroxy-6-metoxy-1,4-benzoquinol methylase
MIDGSTYYQQQSEARRIRDVHDVTKMANDESRVFDRLILKHLPKNSECSIYEAATGPGILQAWLHSRGYKKLTGSDFSENEASLAQKISPGIIHADSIDDLEKRYDTESLDVIIALDFYEHIPRERFRDFLRISYTKLKPGGILILRGPNGDSPFVGLNLYNDITHVWAYTTTCLRALINLAGFKKNVLFKDDSIDGLHYGRWWKKHIMIIVQKTLSIVFWAASRQKIKHFGMSLYSYSIK